MQVPLEVTYRDVPKTDAVEALVQEKIARLERVCDHISSCHIAIEKAHDRPSSGSPYRVRIDLRVPPGHELVADQNPGEGTQYEPLEAVIRDAFEAAERQLKELNERQHDQVKTHPTQSVTGIVTQIFPEGDYGFLKTLEGQEVYFHRNRFSRMTLTALRLVLEFISLRKQESKAPRPAPLKLSISPVPMFRNPRKLRRLNLP